MDQLLSMLQQKGMVLVVDDDPSEDHRALSENAKERKVDKKQAEIASYIVRQQA